MAQSPPDLTQPPPDSLVLASFDGLRNVSQPERLAPGELEVAINVDVDDRGQLRRRVGYRRVLTGVVHSLFTCDDGSVLCVRDGDLGVVLPDYSFRPLGAFVGDDPLAYVQVGNTVYFSSRVTNGKVVDGARVDRWGIDGDLWLTPVEDTTNVGQVAGRSMMPPPLATGLCWNQGRIYLASGRLVWATDLFNYEMVDRVRGFWQFEGDIAFIGSVTAGIYVGTSEGVWYVGGTFREPRRIRVMDGAAIPGSLVSIPAELANPVAIRRKPDQELKVGLAFMTVHGYCVGYDDGQAFNMTEDKFLFPGAVRAHATFRREEGINQYLAVLNSGGTPMNTAQIGDYVDAEIVRAGDRWPIQTEGVRIGDQLTIQII